MFKLIATYVINDLKRIYPALLVPGKIVRNKYICIIRKYLQEAIILNTMYVIIIQ